MAGISTQMKGRFPEKIGRQFSSFYLPPAGGAGLGNIFSSFSFFFFLALFGIFLQSDGLLWFFWAQQKMRCPKTVKNDTLFIRSSSHGQEVWSIMC